MTCPRGPRNPVRAVRAATIALALTAVACLATPVRAQWPGNGRALCTASGDQSYPVMLTDGAGGAFVAWEDRRVSGADIYAQRILGSGAIAPGWPTDGRALCTAAQDQLAPVLAPDGAGGAFVAWEDYRAGGGDPNIYVQRITAAGAIAAGWPANGVGLCTQTDVQGRPTIVSDGAGGAIVAWEDFRDGTGDVYVQRVNATGLPLWGTNGLPVCAHDGDQRFPVAVPDGAGGAIIAWQDTRAGDADIYAQRIDGTGAARWTTDGAVLCAATLDQLGLRITSDGAGGAIASWEDYRADNSDIYAQRIDSAGVVRWTPDGVALCTDLFEQYSAALAPDGAGGALVAWNDLRSGLEDIYAQHVTGLGAIASGWAANGQAVCVASGSQFDPRAATDGAGGAFFTWIDNRPGSAQLDVYALRMTGAGVAASGWAANGKPLCSATGDQTVTAIVPDGLGGAVLGWFDLRSGNADIYALRVTATGGNPTVAVEPGPSPNFELFPAAPNPLRSQTWMRFRLAEPEHVTMRIVDVAGRRVRQLMDEPSLAAGDHEIAWDGRDEAGSRVPGGVYLLVLRAGAESMTAKLAVVR